MSWIFNPFTGKLDYYDDTTVAGHHATHENDGADEISVEGLSGDLADAQDPKDHASNHTDGTDDIQNATAAQKGLATATQITKLDGIEDGAEVNEIVGDGNTGYTLRNSYLLVKNGTNANTVKPSFTARWNGDTISEVDNLGKGNTSGNFELSSDGKSLYIKVDGLSGSGLFAMGNPLYICIGATAIVSITALSETTGDLRLQVNNPVDGSLYDLTVLVDTGNINVDTFYLTNA